MLFETNLALKLIQLWTLQNHNQISQVMALHKTQAAAYLHCWLLFCFAEKLLSLHEKTQRVSDVIGLIHELKNSR